MLFFRKEATYSMAEPSAPQPQSGNKQPQRVQPPSTNPLLNRPANPQLDILVRKGNDPVIERAKQGGQQTTEHKSSDTPQRSEK
jgi:hypothetical protein